MRNIVLVILVSLLVGCNNTIKKPFDRKINLSGQSNFRDLGNYNTVSGEVTKKHSLYRSGTLSGLNSDDVRIIDSLGIKTVVNFLTDDEIKARGKDKLPAGVKSMYFPISGENDEAVDVLLARETGDFTKVPVEFNYSIHKVLVDVGKDSYFNLFKVLSDSINYPVVFHCSHGVHRTGTATALLFMALDIPWETIEYDYLLSNKYRSNETSQRVKILSRIAEENNTIIDKDENLKNIEAFYYLDEKYIEGTKNAIENNYGSINNYLKSIGVDSLMLKNVKSNLLIR